MFQSFFLARRWLPWSLGGTTVILAVTWYKVRLDVRINEWFGQVRKNYFNLYRHYLYFDLVKWSYLQFGVIVPYIMLGPTVISGVITLGVLQQIVRAFERVEGSFQFLVNSWSTIVELMSIYKRLDAFERAMREDEPRSTLTSGEPAIEAAIR